MWGPCRLWALTLTPTLTWGFSGMIPASFHGSFQKDRVTWCLALFLLGRFVNQAFRKAEAGKKASGAAGSLPWKKAAEGSAAVHLSKNSVSSGGSKSTLVSHRHLAAVETGQLWRRAGQNPLGELSAVSRNRCSSRHHSLFWILSCKGKGLPESWFRQTAPSPSCGFSYLGSKVWWAVSQKTIVLHSRVSTCCYKSEFKEMHHALAHSQITSGMLYSDMSRVLLPWCFQCNNGISTSSWTAHSSTNLTTIIQI